MSLSFSSLPGDNFVSIDRDSLQVLLAFALAHGNVNSILSCLQILLGVCKCGVCTCVCVCSVCTCVCVCSVCTCVCVCRSGYKY